MCKLKGLLTRLIFLVAMLSSPLVAAEYLITAGRPDKLFLIEAETGEVARTLTVPGQTIGSWSIVVAPDNRTVYVTTDKHESLIGLDIASGEVVFKAKLGEPGVQVRSHYGHDISPDGKEFYAYAIRTRQLADEYQVLDNQVLVFDTTSGLDAKPVRVLPAPRRVFNMATAEDGASLFLASWDFYQIDVENGDVLNKHLINNWDIENRGPGNAYGQWVSSEQSGVHTMPVFSVHVDRDPYSVEAYQNGITQIDKKTGEFSVWDYEYAENLVFAVVTSPTKPEVFTTYNTMAKIDSANKKTVKRVPLEATYYTINISADGETVFVGGGGCKVAAHHTSDLSRKWGIKLPGCADQSFSVLRMVSDIPGTE